MTPLILLIFFFPATMEPEPDSLTLLPLELLGEIAARLDDGTRFARFAKVNRLCRSIAFKSPYRYFDIMTFQDGSLWKAIEFAMDAVGRKENFWGTPGLEGGSSFVLYYGT